MQIDTAQIISMTEANQNFSATINSRAFPNTQ